MAHPKISDLEKVLKKQDWQWSPYFKTTPLGFSAVKKEISDYYLAVDKAIEEYEANLRKDLENAQPSSWDSEKQRCRNVLMTYTHSGMRKTFVIRHRQFFEDIGVFGLWRSRTNLWYFVIGWQFLEWYEHVLEVYTNNQFETFQNITHEAYERLEGGLSKSLSTHFINRQIELLEEELDGLANEGDEYDVKHRRLFLDIWLNLHGIELNVSEKAEVIGWTYNRLSDD